MNLGELIDRLSREDQNKVIYNGICNPHSYRGWYERLAFEDGGVMTVGDCVGFAKSAVGNVFIGWKGGEFLMTLDTLVYSASRGSTGEEIDDEYLDEMLNN